MRAEPALGRVYEELGNEVDGVGPHHVVGSTRQIGKPRIELDGRDLVECDAPPCREVIKPLRVRAR